MAKKAKLTVEEAVATLLRTGLPTVLAEGNDDMLALRLVEERCADLGVSIFPVGGKQTALKVWRSLREQGKRDALVIVDRDLWLFEGTPEDYQTDKIIQTNGFSIENDLCQDWNWENLLTSQERERYKEELCTVCEWFENRLARLRGGEDVAISDHPVKILANPEVPAEARFEVFHNYRSHLRGKTLLELIVRHLSHTDRLAKHSKRSLLETSAVSYGLNLQRIEERIRLNLAAGEA